MNNREREPFESAYENGKVKPVTAAALKATAQMEQEMAARVEQMKASQPNLGEEDKNSSFAIGENFYKDALQDDSDPQAVVLRNFRIHALKKMGALEPWTHDGILEDKVYELAATFEMGRILEGHLTTANDPMYLEKFVKALRAQEK